MPDRSVHDVIQIASRAGVSSCSVVGHDRLVEFHADGMTTTAVMKVDLDSFGPHAILGLIDFFPGRLSKELFWPV